MLNLASYFFKDKRLGARIAPYDPRVIPAGAFLDTQQTPQFIRLNNDDFSQPNQASTAACTVHATTYAKGYKNDKELSPRYGFKMIKDPKNGYASSSLSWGAYSIDAVKVAIAGVCDYELCPNTNTHSDRAYLDFTITDEMRKSAQANAGGGFAVISRWRENAMRVPDAEFRKMCLSALWKYRAPIYFVMDWFPSFNRPLANGDLPKASGSPLGHAVALIESNGERDMVRNSFGEKWGNKGTFSMLPYHWAHVGEAYVLIDEIKQRTFVMPPEELRNRDAEKVSATSLRVAILSMPKEKQEKAGLDWLNLVARLTYGTENIEDILASL